jgi:PAS domain S-box-containing protein
MKNLLSLHPLIELFASTITLSLAIYVIARNPEDRLSRSFSFFTFILAIASLFEYSFRVTPFEQSLQMYLLHRFGIVFWSFGFSAFLFFALVFSENRKALSNPLTYLVLYLPPLLISIMYLFTNLAVKGYVHMPYGNASIVAPGVIFFLLHATLYSLIALIIVLKTSLKTGNPILIKRGLLITIAIIIPILSGFLTNAILPLVLKIRWMPPQTITGVCILCLLTFIAIRRYSLFAITPDQAIDAILETTSGAIMAVNVDFKVSFANQSTSRLLNSPSEEEVKGKSLKDFFNKSDHKLISQQLIMNEQPIKDLKTTIKTFIGEERVVKLNGVVLKDKFGTKIGALLDFEDITERQKAEQVQKSHLEELEKMNKFLVGREIEMVELKKEINALLQELGRPKKYTT